jgi:hypothetical protein
MRKERSLFNENQNRLRPVRYRASGPDRIGCRECAGFHSCSPRPFSLRNGELDSARELHVYRALYVSGLPHHRDRCVYGGESGVDLCRDNLATGGQLFRQHGVWRGDVHLRHLCRAAFATDVTACVRYRKHPFRWRPCAKCRGKGAVGIATSGAAVMAEIHSGCRNLD